MYRKLLISMTLAALLAPAAGADSLAGLAGPAGMLRPVDRVIVQKSNRRMELYRDGAIVATYKISLGLQPVGQKQREGDFRTPEGRYRLTRRNARSDFYLAVQVSYPEAIDLALARRNGWQPGGAIMVHGLPNFQKYARERYLSTDWTDGCIALSNEDMLDFWLLTGTGHADRDPSVSGNPGLDLSAVVHARVSPKGVLDNLSQQEVDKLLDRGQGGLYPLFRRCALAVLNSGTLIDDARLIFDAYKDFELRIVREPWGIKLEMQHAPGSAFVDGEMIKGVKEHLFAVLRDIVYTHNEIVARFDLEDSASVTNAIFCILRNARALEYKGRPDLVVCWGGHSISREEYDYTKQVGYELGLREFSVCTGCGPGAMKGPMKGATIGHSKQRIKDGRYIGITEPGIIAAEPPNPIVNQLVIMPDIEKRLEAFVRLCHGIVVFPGGAGTAEEILYLLGILLDPVNASQPLPLVFTGPRESEGYFRQLDDFIGHTLGQEARQRYKFIVDDPPEVARAMQRGFDAVRRSRRRAGDAYNYNWLLRIPPAFQKPFEVSHAAMAGLELSMDQPVHERAANLRRAFSGIVAGNVKERGIRLIEEYGPFEIHAAPEIAKPLDELLRGFVAERRMKLVGEYRPSYRIV